jgi:serine phosphatase RsbU (regulator of sigma subunit)
MKTDGDDPHVTRETRRWAPLLLDRVRCRVALIDRSATILECSGSLLDHLGLPRDGVIGNKFTDPRFWPGEKDTPRRLRTALSHLADGGDTRVVAGTAHEPYGIALTPVVAEGRGGDRAGLVFVDLDTAGPASPPAEPALLLADERGAGRRAAALHRVTAALSEAITSEEVATVMVEESLRSLGACAASVELWGAAAPGGPTRRRRTLHRTAGAARLLSQAPGSGDGTTRIVLPLGCRGNRHGDWTLAWEEARPRETANGPLPGPLPGGARLWSPTDWTGQDCVTALQALAEECGQAIDRAELYERQRDIARALQQPLLPSLPPRVEGARIAARCQPGEQGVDVGGDWYDVIELPRRRTGLVIGDVEGHSPAAAAVMGQVRNALRTYALEDLSPAVVVQRANRLLAQLGVDQLVSCCYLEFASREGTATIVLAGHPPPLLVVPEGGADFVRAHPNLILGVDATTRYAETTVLLDPGALLVLYTDGLIETINRSLEESMTTLRHWAGEWEYDEPVGELVERLVGRACEGQRVLDDIAVLALQYHPDGRRLADRSRTVRRAFPHDPCSMPAARQFVTDILTQWRLDSVVGPVTTMADTLVTRSMRPACGELELALRADGDTLHVEVLDTSDRSRHQSPSRRPVEAGGQMAPLEVLSHRWGIDTRPTGKASWFTVRLEGTD